MYDTAEQSSLRLRGTIVAYKNRPVIVLEVNADNTLNIADVIGKRNVAKVALNDPDLNIQEFKLGYVNYQGRALYLTRVPARQQRQGLCRQNIVVKAGDFRNYFVDGMLSSAGFVDAFQGIYPTFEEAVNVLRTNLEVESVAFARRFALKRDVELGYFELFYRGDKIAWGDPNQFNIPSEYLYMSELMKQEGINIR